MANAENTQNEPGKPLTGSIENGRVYGSKNPQLMQGTAGQLYADDRQVTGIEKTGKGAADYDVTYKTASGGKDQTASLTAFVAWAGNDVTEQLAPSLAGEGGEQTPMWRPWHTVGGAVLDINQHPTPEEIVSQLPVGSRVVLVSGNATELGGTPAPDGKATLKASKPKKEASEKKAGKGKKADKVPADAVAAADAANRAAGTPPPAPVVVVNNTGNPEGQGAPAGVNPPPAVTDAKNIETGAPDAGNETHTAENQPASAPGTEPGTGSKVDGSADAVGAKH